MARKKYGVPIETEKKPVGVEHSYFFPNIGNGVVVKAYSLREAREKARKLPLKK